MFQITISRNRGTLVFKSTCDNYKEKQGEFGEFLLSEVAAFEERLRRFDGDSVSRDLASAGSGGPGSAEMRAQIAGIEKARAEGGVVSLDALSAARKKAADDLDNTGGIRTIAGVPSADVPKDPNPGIPVTGPATVPPAVPPVVPPVEPQKPETEDPLHGVSFASDAARKLAEESGLRSSDFIDSGVEAGQHGFTKPQVQDVVDATSAK